MSWVKWLLGDLDDTGPVRCDGNENEGYTLEEGIVDIRRQLQIEVLNLKSE